MLLSFKIGKSLKEKALNRHCFGNWWTGREFERATVVCRSVPPKTSIILREAATAGTT